MFAKLNELLKVAEKWLMTLLFFALLSVSALQIILRNVFDSGLMWGDDFIKVMVLWIGFVGATYAARNGKHINVDVITRFLPGRYAKLIYRLMYLATAALCATAAWFSWQFVQIEMEDNMMAFLNVPVWLTEIIIPIAFALIGLRYLNLFFQPKVAVVQKAEGSQ